MRVIFLFILLLSTVNPIDAQNKQLDSLRILLPNLQADSNKVKKLMILSKKFIKQSMPDSALFFANQALDLSKSIDYKKGEVESSLFLSQQLWLLSDYSSGLKYSLPIYEYAKQTGDSTLIQSAGMSVFHNYRDMGDYKQALRVLFNENPFLTNISENPRQYFLRYVVVASCYYGLEKYDTAMLYLNTAMLDPRFKKQGWSLLIAGRVEAKLNNKEKALNYFRQSIKQLSDLKYETSFKDLAGAYISMATLFEETSRIDSSIHYGELAIEVAQLKKNSKELMQGYFILSKAYEPVDASKSLYYLQLYAEEKDQVYNVEKQRQFAQYQYDELRRVNEINAAEQKHKSRIRTNTLAGILITLFIIAVFLYRNSRQKQRAKKKIEHAYEKLKSTQSQLIQSEKMASLGELTAGIAHEIQNPLNFVNNFSEVNSEMIDELNDELNKGDIKEAKAISKDIKENENKINHHGKRAEAIVKGMLQHSRTSSGQKELTNINTLADEYLRLSYHGLRAKDKSFNADFKTAFDGTLPKIDVIPQDIGRVLLNLINNAFYAVDKKAKEATPLPPKGVVKNADTDYKPMVTVVTTSSKSPLGDLGVKIIVKDNGSGIPQNIVDKIFQPFFTTKPTGSGTGLGLSLSYDIVKAHGGKIKVESNMGEGTNFIVTIPINN